MRKARKPKDKNAPKRGLSAYMFFTQDQRDKVKEENPGIAFTDVAKVLGQKWKELSAEEKAPYEEQAANDKKRYESAKAEYDAQGGVGGGEDGGDGGGGAVDEGSGDE